MMVATAKISLLDRDLLPVCPVPWNLNRLVSLLDMITYFDASRFGQLLSELEAIRSTLGFLSENSGGLAAGALFTTAKGRIEQAREFCEHHEFKGAFQIVNTSLSYLKVNPDVHISTLMAEVRHVHDGLIAEAINRKFVSVLPDRAKYLGQEEPFGKQVYDAFPSARFDITEAGNCLACGINSAAGFHLMRAAEIGLWELGMDRQIPLAQAGKIEFSEWGIIIRELEAAVQAITQWPNCPTKEDAHKFYNSALVEIRAFNDGWRRHLAHVRKTQVPLHDDEALALWGHVERFFKNISTKISEGIYTALIW